MKKLFSVSLLGLFCSLTAHAAIDEATRQRAIDFVGGLRPPPVIRTEMQTPAFEGTLKKLYEGGVLHLGYREDAYPLSFYGKDKQPAGLVWDLCTRVGEALRQHLGLSELKVVAVPVTPNTRDLYLNNGTIDLECGATANNQTRQRRQAFGVTTYVASIGILTRKDNPVASVADLANRAVVSLSGSQAERYTRTSAALRGANVRYLQANDADEAMRMLEEKKADAFVGEDLVLALGRASLPAPRAAGLVLAKDALAFEPLAIMLRKDDVPLKKILDDTLVGLMRSGEYEKLYHRWFESPAGPDGLNLNLPISDPLRSLIKNPNDQGV